MQIDQGAKKEEDVQVSLREVAGRMLEQAFTAKLTFLQENFLSESPTQELDENNKRALEQVKSFENFKTKLHPHYVEALLSQIEASLILQSYIKDEESLAVFAEASIECQKRLVQREEQATRMFTSCLKSTERLQALMTKELVGNCISLIKQSQNEDMQFDAAKNASHCIGYLQILSSVMKQVRATSAKSYQAAHQGVKQLVLEKKDAADESERPFLLDLLAQISEI